MTPWNIGADGYCGLIDEVHISCIVRPEYVIAEPLSEELKAAARPRRRPALDTDKSKGPLLLEPETTFVVLPERDPGQGNFDAARELQRWLRAAWDTDRGFGKTPQELRKRIEAAVRWATADGQKTRVD